MSTDERLSRRQFISSAAITAAGALLAPSHAARAASYSLDPRVAALVATCTGIDTHNHIDVPLDSASQPGPDIDLAEEMKRSGLSAICATFATDYGPGDAYERFSNGFAAIDRQLERNRIKRALTAADLRNAHQQRQRTVVQSVEGGHFLQGKIERVEEAYKRGLRHFGLLHDSDATVPLGDVYTNPPRFGGLTAFGQQVIAECNRLGMLVDLAHASFETTKSALAVAKRPVIVSHTGLDTQLGNDPRMAQMMRPRLISKEHATMVANAGGLIGVWTHLADTPLDYAKNIRALVGVIGVEHVCIGTDTKLTTPYTPPRTPARPPHAGERTNQAWPDQRVGFLSTVVDAMLKTGFTAQEIQKVSGGNYLRVFGEACDT